MVDQLAFQALKASTSPTKAR